MTMQPTATIVVDAEPLPAACQYCDAEAAATCPRCDTLYCEAHGGAVCDTCSRPATGLPSPMLFRAAAATLLAGGLLAFVLLVTRPRLPGEGAPGPASGGPPAATAAPAGGAAAPRVTATPAATPVPETYTVKAGDTFNAIAAQLGIEVDALRAANPGADPTALQIGQQLVIPARR